MTEGWMRRVSFRDHPDGGGDLVGVGVFEQKAARSRGQGVVDVLVDVEGGQTSTCVRASVGFAVMSRVASMPFRRGMRTSMSTTSA